MARTKISEFSATPANNTDIDSINIAEGCAPSGINDAIRELMAQLKDWQSGTSNDPMVIGSSGSLTLNQGTANGVTYLNGSKVVTSGSALTFDGTNLGVGTSSPSEKLHVNSGTGNVPALFESTDPIAVVQFKDNNSTLFNAVGVQTNSLIFYSADNINMRLDNSGNLGLGVTPSAWYSGWKALEIGSGTAIWRVSGQDFRMSSNLYNDGSNSVYKANGAAAFYAQGSGAHTWYNAPSGTAGNTVAFTQAMTLDASGNLGVGTTSTGANHRLEVAGAQKYLAVTANAGSGGTANPSSSSGLFMSWNRSNGEGESNIVYGTGAGTSPALAFGSWNGTTYAERARIDSSGNLLLNTTSSRTGVNSISIEPSGNNYIEFRKSGSGSSTQIQFNRNTDTTPTSAGSISTTGTTASYNTSSDYRLKQDIAPITNALDKVTALKPVTFKWNTDGSDGEGFIAHELAEVCPQAVTGEKDAVDEDGNPQYQGIDVSFLVATLTAALQEAHGLIKNLETRISALEAK